MYENNNLKILYVEDDKVLNEQYQAFYERRCSELFVAFNGEEGLESFKQNKPDIVVTDIRMPTMDGLEMIQEIRKIDKNIPIVVTSAFNDQDYLLKAINQGVSRYVLKPFNRTLLRQIIDETIEFINLKKKEEYYKNITQEYYEIIDENVIGSRTDLDGIITYASKAFCKMSGYSKEELIGKNHNIVKYHDNPKEIYEQLWETIVANKQWEGELKNITKEGKIYWVKAKIYPLFDGDKKIGYSSIRENITDKKLLEELSIKDGLTDIYNRRFYNTKVIEFLNISKRRDELVCFLMIDIDYFKLYNDNYGHQKGDEVLISVAKVLKSFIKRADDYCFRIGGEEFAILFISDETQNAIDFSNRIRVAIEDLKIEHEFNEVSDFITVSMGLYCQNATKIENSRTLFKKGDDLLYKSKESGRNKVSFGSF